jgi:hypothetical protein
MGRSPEVTADEYTCGLAVPAMCQVKGVPGGVRSLALGQLHSLLLSGDGRTLAVRRAPGRLRCLSPVRRLLGILLRRENGTRSLDAKRHAWLVQQSSPLRRSCCSWSPARPVHL